MEREREESGEYAPSVTDEEILEAVETHEPAATSEVGEEVGVVRQTADYRLRQLRDEERVRSKKIGASLVWFRTADRQQQRDSEVEVGENPEPGEVNEQPPEPSRDISAVVDELELQGSGPPLRERKAAIVAILEYLRERESARAGELKDIADKFDHGFGSVESFWSNSWRRDAIDDLVDMGVVESGGSAGVYYWSD